MVWITLPNEYDEDERQWVRHTTPLRMQGTAFNTRCYLDFLCNLNVESNPHRTWRATNIACNVGHPVNRSVETLQQMMESGMNIARINLTLNYGDLKYHSQTVRNIRQAALNYSKKIGITFPIALGCNTIGPLVRTGYLEGGLDSEIELKAGYAVKVTTDPAFKDKGSIQVIYIDYEEIFEWIVVGRIIWIDDGCIKLRVKAISGAFMTCDIEIGGMLGNQKPVNLPGTLINLPAICEDDKVFLRYAIAENFDFIFCTFVRNIDGILAIRKELGEEGKHIKLIANIEDLQGLDNIDEIITVADGIVVARGDLYLEVTIPKMFMAQKYIIAKCNRLGCPVFVSRELIESMMARGQPTRSDVGDLTNVILDGCDNIILSRETLEDNYLDKILKFVSQTCKEAEALAWRSKDEADQYQWRMGQNDLVSTTLMTAVDASIKLCAAAIFAITTTGFTAQIVSKYRPRCPIIAITRNSRVARQLNLYRSVIPFLYSGAIRSSARRDIDAQVGAAIKFGKKRRFIKANDPLVIVNCGKINTMRIHYVPETIKMINNVMCIS